MKQTIKMVKVRFGDLKVEGKPENLVELYRSKGAELKKPDDWYWYHCDRPNDIDQETWQQMRKDQTKEYLEYIESNPVFSSFDISMQIDEYSDLIFRFGDKARFEITERFELNVTVNLEGIDSDLIRTNVELMQKQYEQLKEFSIGVEQLAYNQKCNTPTSDAFLHNVNQTCLLEDCCTDYLQGKLKDGWRIISVTPQPNQRRPDYVLGKTVDTNNVNQYAYRD